MPCPMRSAPIASARPNRFRARRFSGMAHQPQAAVARISEHVAEPLRRPAHFIAADAVRDDSFVAPRNRELGHFHPFFGPNCRIASRIQNA